MSTETRTQEPQTPTAPQPSVERPIVFTNVALEKIKLFTETHDEARGKYLRLYVQGGGCSGFEYGFTFDDPKDGDERIAQGEGGEVEVLVDHFSLPYLEGSIVDYFEDFSGSGFKVRNPNATGTCGCGHSFSA